MVDQLLDFFLRLFVAIVLCSTFLAVWESCRAVDEKNKRRHERKCMGGEDE